jgi:hypothetical protein
LSPVFTVPLSQLLNQVYCLLLEGIHDRESYDELHSILADDGLSVRERALQKLESATR